MIRKIVLLVFTVASSLIFIFQLMALQLFNSDYSERSMNNAVEKRPVYPARGLIFDRNGTLWVANKPVYDLMVVPDNLNLFDTLELISGLNISKEELLDKIKNAEYFSFGDGENWMSKMIASGTLPVLVRTPSLINGQRKFDGGVADPLPVQKAYEMGAKEITIIRTYEKSFRRKLKIENYIGALFSNQYPKLKKALLNHDKTYNRALDFIENPPSDCKIIQLCPPQRLKTKRDSKNITLLKADYELGKKVAEDYLSSLNN